MSEQPPVPPTSHDFPDHWGFYLLQAINRLDDKLDASIGRLDAKIDEVRRDMNQRVDSLDAKIDAVRRDMNQRVDSLDAKIDAVQRDVAQRFDTMDQKITTLQYWYWGTLVVIIMGFVTLLLTRP